MLCRIVECKLVHMYLWHVTHPAVFITHLWIYGMYVYVCTYVCMYVCMYEYIHAWCMYVCMYVCRYVCMYICMYAYMYVYLYVCICFVHGMISLFSCFICGKNLLVSIDLYLLLVPQNFLRYYGIHHFLFYRSGLLRIRCNHFCYFYSVFSVIGYKRSRFLVPSLRMRRSVQKG